MIVNFNFSKSLSSLPLVSNPSRILWESSYWRDMKPLLFK